MTTDRPRQQDSYVNKGLNMTDAAAYQSQIPRAGGTGFQRVHVTLMRLLEKDIELLLP
jgi:hypothetical protein